MGLDIKLDDEGLKIFEEIQEIQEMDVWQAIRNIEAIFYDGALNGTTSKGMPTTLSTSRCLS